jgi:hypothetical protein
MQCMAARQHPHFTAHLQTYRALAVYRKPRPTSLGGHLLVLATENVRLQPVGVSCCQMSALEKTAHSAARTAGGFLVHSALCALSLAGILAGAADLTRRWWLKRTAAACFCQVCERSDSFYHPGLRRGGWCSLNPCTQSARAGVKSLTAGGYQFAGNDCRCSSCVMVDLLCRRTVSDWREASRWSLEQALRHPVSWNDWRLTDIRPVVLWAAGPSLTRYDPYMQIGAQGRDDGPFEQMDDQLWSWLCKSGARELLAENPLARTIVREDADMDPLMAACFTGHLIAVSRLLELPCIPVHWVKPSCVMSNIYHDPLFICVYRNNWSCAVQFLGTRLAEVDLHCCNSTGHSTFEFLRSWFTKFRGGRYDPFYARTDRMVSAPKADVRFWPRKRLRRSNGSPMTWHFPNQKFFIIQFATKLRSALSALSSNRMTIIRQVLPCPREIAGLIDSMLSNSSAHFECFPFRRPTISVQSPNIVHNHNNAAHIAEIDLTLDDPLHNNVDVIPDCRN